MLPDGRLEEATRIAHAVSEVTNVPPYSRQPYVGASAFAHKAGLHASAIRIDPDLYQHTDPMRVGNDMRMLVSDMAGRASIELKARELGYDLAGQDELLSRVVTRVKELELRGYTFDAADASFELLLRGEVQGARLSYFDVESWRVITDSVRRRRGAVRGHRQARRGRPAGRRDRGGQRPGQRARPRAAAGPDDRLPRDRQARADRLPGAHPRRRPRHRRGHPGADRDLATATTSWETVGVAANIVEASWLALVDGITYGLLRQGVSGPLNRPGGRADPPGHLPQPSRMQQDGGVSDTQHEPDGTGGILPSVRIGTPEREAAVTALDAHWQEGRLDPAEHERRTTARPGRADPGRARRPLRRPAGPGRPARGRPGPPCVPRPDAASARPRARVRAPPRKPGRSSPRHGDGADAVRGRRPVLPLRLQLAVVPGSSR